MSAFSFKKLWNYNYGIGALIVLFIIAWAASRFTGYLNKKGSYGSESNQTMQQQYKNTKPKSNKGVRASEPLGEISTFASANGTQTSMPGLPKSCNTPTISSPSELLPKDSNSQWAQLNPSGKGELANVNLLKEGYHIGIDTIGQTLRNANLQIRSEPPNPQLYVGPWNQSTIEPDFMRPPLELGSGPQ